MLLELSIDLPPRNYYGIGMCFLPRDAALRSQVAMWSAPVPAALLRVSASPVRSCSGADGG
jgi:hypothetical protein